MPAGFANQIILAICKSVPPKTKASKLLGGNPFTSVTSVTFSNIFTEVTPVMFNNLAFMASTVPLPENFIDFILLVLSSMSVSKSRPVKPAVKLLTDIQPDIGV